jgi:ubiquinone/menaquinone biosynthesis C-methylase UbiE
MDMEVETSTPPALAAATEAYWDRKAEHGARDPDRAVGVAEPGINRCIDRAQRPLVNRAIRRAADNLGHRGRAVLDFGCGVGRWVPALTESFPDYHGIDISSSMVRLASERYPGHRFSKLDDMTLRLDDESFDFVTSIAVLHHNAYAIQEKLLREFHRVLRPGGELLLFEAIGKRTNEEVAVFYPRPAGEWIDIIQHHGFQLARTRGTAYHVLSAALSKLLGSSAWMSSRLGSGVLWLDSMVTPGLSPLLPERFHVRQLMSFRKVGEV